MVLNPGSEMSKPGSDPNMALNPDSVVSKPGPDLDPDPNIALNPGLIVTGPDVDLAPDTNMTNPNPGPDMGSSRDGDDSTIVPTG